MNFKLLILTAVTIAFLNACRSDNKFQGTWETAPVVPEQGQSGFTYIPKKITLKISEKHLRFNDESPVRYTALDDGDKAVLKVHEDSLDAIYMQYNHHKITGKYPVDLIKDMQNVHCAVSDSQTMQCSMIQFWIPNEYRSFSGNYNKSPHVWLQPEFSVRRTLLFSRVESSDN